MRIMVVIHSSMGITMLTVQAIGELFSIPYHRNILCQERNWDMYGICMYIYLTLSGSDLSQESQGYNHSVSQQSKSNW